MNKFLGIVLILILAGAAYLVFWPVPIEPVAWDAPEAPGLEGPYAVNDRLAGVEWLAKGVASGPEDVAVDDQGRIYGAYADGKIRRLQPDGSGAAVFADTGGRPLGMDWAPDGSLVVADAVRGLLAVRPDGTVRTLATAAAGVPFGFVDDVAVAEDGTVYFSDASHKFGMHHVMADIIEHGGNGRLLKYEPMADEVTVLLQGLQFANGVAVGPGERYVLVNETGAYRVTRYWLTGDAAGGSDTFAANLPGFPDNISYDGEDTFWLAIYAPRNPSLDYMSDKPFLRKVAYRLPEQLQPGTKKHAIVLGLSTGGDVLYNLQDASADAYAPITAVEEVGDILYFGSLTAPAMARMPVPDGTR
ncbi:Strictosidine synthase subfamily protein [Salinisphaera sp. PC39]|uniref:SMP-30/gluconolactonase/LRE family protein n=1 Tax=Salinisphaera sp. PC39 TaxID=1304156 RepID=UPI0033407ECC